MTDYTPDIDSQALKGYSERKKAYEAKIPSSERKIVDSLMDKLREAYKAVPEASNPNDLIALQTEISALLEPLGEIAVQGEAQCQQVRSYVEEKNAERYDEIKTELEKNKPRVLKYEIESVLEKETREESRLADWLEERYKLRKALLFSSSKVLDAIQNKTILLRKEMDYVQNR